MNELFMVEFLFDSEDFTEVRVLGIFTDDILAESVAFDYAEEHIENPDMTALYITKFIPNETGTEELVVEHYFGEEA